MLISLHKLATTTPKVGAAIQGSDASTAVLAERYGVTEQTIYKRRTCDKRPLPPLMQPTAASTRTAPSGYSI